MPVVVVATITPIPEHRQAVQDALTSAIPDVHAEPGCNLYALHTTESAFIMVEHWDSPEALDTHSKGDAIARLGAALAGKVTGAPVVVVTQPVPAGDPTKGQVLSA